MGDLFTLTPDILAVGKSAFDSLIHQLGKMCRLVFDPTNPSPCPNCILDPNTKKSTGKYNGTGPKSFSGGRCPICQGVGFLQAVETHKDVQLLINWKPNLYHITDEQLKLPNTVIATKGFVIELLPILQAKYVIINFQHAEFENNRFVRMGEPVVQGNIIKDQYVECYWKREGV